MQKVSIQALHDMHWDQIKNYGDLVPSHLVDVLVGLISALPVVAWKADGARRLCEATACAIERMSESLPNKKREEARAARWRELKEMITD